MSYIKIKMTNGVSQIKKQIIDRKCKRKFKQYQISNALTNPSFKPGTEYDDQKELMSVFNHKRKQFKTLNEKYCSKYFLL